MNPKPSPLSFLEDSLRRRLLLFTGKGGVGKSSLALATAIALSRRGKRVTLLRWNPYESGTTKIPTAENHSVRTILLEPMQCFREYALNIVKFEGIYSAIFENHVLKTFVRTAPGVSDTVIAGKIWDLYNRAEQDILVVDLPSSGHTLSFFQSPFGVNKLLRIGLVHRETDKICRMFLSPNTRIDFIATPEELPIEESKQFKDKLEKLGPLPFGHLLMNQVIPSFDWPPLTGNTPRAILQYFNSIKERQMREETCIESAKNLGLPIVRVPRFPSENVAAMLSQMTAALENP